MQEWLSQLQANEPAQGEDRHAFNSILKQIGRKATFDQFVDVCQGIRRGLARPRWITVMIMLQTPERKRELRYWLRFTKGGRPR